MTSDPADEASDAIRTALDATTSAATSIKALDDFELSASVAAAVAGAKWDLQEALRRLGRPEGDR